MIITTIIRKSIRKLISVLPRIRPKERWIIFDRIRPLRVGYIISGGIGDALMAYPALQLIRRTLPNASIAVYIPAQKYSVVKALFTDCNLISYLPGLPFVFSSVWRIKSYDVVLTNTTSVFKLSVEIAAFFMGAMKFGFRYKEDKVRNRLYTNSLVYSDTMHEAEQNLQLVAHALSVDYHSSDVFYPVAENRQHPPLAKNIVIHPGSEKGYERKQWPLQYYKALVTTLVEKGYTVTMLLGPSERLLKDTLKGERGITMPSSPSAGEAIEALKNAQLFIGNDSGPAHIAAFLGTPALVLFGPTDPARCRPLSAQVKTVYAHIDCSPCHFTDVQCTDNRCMQAISVEQVLKEIEQIL